MICYPSSHSWGVVMLSFYLCGYKGPEMGFEKWSFRKWLLEYVYPISKCTILWSDFLYPYSSSRYEALILLKKHHNLNLWSFKTIIVHFLLFGYRIVIDDVQLFFFIVFTISIHKYFSARLSISPKSSRMLSF